MRKIYLLSLLALIPTGIAFAIVRDQITLDCGTAYSNCVIAINREQNKSAETCFYKNGTEQVCLLERFGGVFSILIRTNSTVDDYALQFMPHGQEIHNYKIFMINESGYYCQLKSYSNGTIKCIQGDPTFDSTD